MQRVILPRSDLLEAFSAFETGDLQQAETVFRKLPGIDPAQPDSLNQLGDLAARLGQFDAAAALIRQAIERVPNHPIYHERLGDTYRAARRFPEAVDCYRQALGLDPRQTSTWLRLAVLCQRLGNYAEARRCFSRALKLAPHSAKALRGLGSLSKEEGEYETADRCYQAALKRSTDVETELKRALLLPVIATSAGEIQAARKRVGDRLESLRRKRLNLQDPYAQGGGTLFHLAYHGLNNLKLQQQLAGFYQDACPALVYPPRTSIRRPSGGNRIRIGLVSRFLHRHTIGRLNSGIVKHLSRRKFHVTIFRFPGPSDPVSESIDAAADAVVALEPNLWAARETLGRHPVDILFYPDIGMEPLTYFLAFGRHAPIQCTTWGHPDTTGIPNIDYYLSFDLSEPPRADSHYSEQLVRLRRFPMYFHPPKTDPHRECRHRLGLPDSLRLYLCPQSLFKLHPDFDVTLGTILRRDPKGVLLLFDGKHPNWSRLVHRRMAGSLPDVIDRIRFHPRVSSQRFLTYLGAADAVLDTPWFNGGFTSLTAFACGMPPITWPGEFMRSRLTLGFYRLMDLNACIAESAEQFVELSLRSANDTAWRHHIGEQIASRVSLLFEDGKALCELENFFEAAVNQRSGSRADPELPENQRIE